MSVIEQINKDPLEFINKISKNVVYNLVEKQINTKITDVEKKEIKTVYDAQSILDLQYKKYYYPTSNKDEYIEMSKDIYYLLLFKLIDIYDLELLTINMLQKTMNINTLIENNLLERKDIKKINEKKLEIINKENCSFVQSFYKTIKLDDKKEYNKYIQITIEKDKFDVLIKEYDNYMKLKYSEYYRKYISTKKVNIKSTLNINEVIYNYKTGQKSIEVIFYPDFEDYKLNRQNTTMTIDKYEKHNSFIFFSFLVFLIKNCSSNYMSMITGIYLIKKDNDNNDKYSNHRNIFIYQLVKDENNKEKVLCFQYEPHGSKQAFSYHEFKIGDFYNYIKKYTKLCKDIDKDFPEFVIHSKSAVCPKGPQTLAGDSDRGMCTIYSTFWYNCFMNIIETIKLIESQYNIKTLSNIELTYWIRFIDYHLVNIKKEYKIKYLDGKYDYYTLFYIKRQMIIEHYNKYVKDEYKSLKDYEEHIDDMFYRMYRNDKITMEDFIEFYYERIYIPIIWYKMGISDDKVKKIKEGKYNMSQFEYYNIFINYIYNLITFILSSKYFEKEKELLNKYSQKEIINTVKDFVGKYNIVNIPSDNRDFIIKYKIQKNIYDEYLEDYNLTEKKSVNIKKNEQEKINSEQNDEMKKLIKKLESRDKNKLGQDCSNNSECGGNLICDQYNQCNIDYKKQMIGNFCVQNDECYSGYCTKDKICRKAIIYC